MKSRVNRKILLAAILLAFPQHETWAAELTARPADSFVEAIGVNMHIFGNSGTCS